MTDNVLIVGGGPVGLTLACELYRHGVPCRVVEREPQPHEQSRATDIQAGTLRLLDDMGVLDAFLAQGVARDELAMFAEGEVVNVSSVTELDTPYPFMLGLGQNESERLLEAHLERLGGKLERGISVREVRAEPDHVNVTLEGPTGPSTECFDWVVGCDGSHSAVRRSVGLKLAGSTLPDRFFLADADLVTDRSEREIGLWTGKAGFLIVLPIPGTVRVFGDLDPGAEGELGFEDIRREIVARTCGKIDATAVGWTATFNVHARIVDRYREGRVLLAGDAAHIHSPAGGHGMNTGLHDACNLGWKLALVARGLAGDTLLDSYDAERRPIGRAVVTETEWETRAAAWRSGAGQVLLGRLIGMALKVGPLRRRMMIHALELDIDYRDSPIVGEARSGLLGARLIGNDQTEDPCFSQWREFAAGPGPGAVAPDVRFGEHRMVDVLRGTTHTLLLFDGAAATAEGYERLSTVAAAVESAFGQFVTVHVVVPADTHPEGLRAGSVLLDPASAAHGAYGAGAECAYLVRPDGHVGFRTQPASAEPLIEHLTRLFEVG